MKQIILSLMVLAFAVSVQAADVKTSQTPAKDQPSCCSEKVKTSDQAKGGCSMAKASCCKQETVKPTVLLSPKAADTRN